MDDDLDPFAPGAMSFTPAHKLTGETFFMRPPNGMDRKRPVATSLIHAIQNAGGTVVTMPISPTNGRSFYTRDLGITLSIAGKNYFFHPEPDDRTPKLAAELREVQHSGPLQQASLQGNLTMVPIDGSFEGGNLVYDPAKRLLFVGLSHHHFLKSPELASYLEMGADASERMQADMQKNIAPQVRGLALLKQKIQEIEAQNGVPRDQRIQVVPLFIPDEKAHASDGECFYHLDGALGILPNGKAMACPAAFTAPHPATGDEVPNASFRKLRRIYGDALFEVTQEEAKKGATNFITVGSTVIPTFANQRLREFFEGCGFTVSASTDQKIPGSSDDWLFNSMAGVRCATQKLTADMQFPPPDRTQAVSNPR